MNKFYICLYSMFRLHIDESFLLILPFKGRGMFTGEDVKKNIPHNYCVNKNKDENGFHEVHKLKDCTDLRLPSISGKRTFYAINDYEAMTMAMKWYSKVDGCKYCMPDFHSC